MRILKAKYFFLPLICVLIIAAFFTASYFVYVNSDSVVNPDGGLTVTAENDHSYSLKVQGETHLIDFLPDKEVSALNAAFPSVIKIDLFIYSVIRDLYVENLKKLSENS